MARIAVFDINETTLDLAPVRAVVDELVAPEGGFVVWFQRLLQLSMTVTTTGSYVDFSTLARHALDAVAASGGRLLPESAWSRVAAAMGMLEAHPDVTDGLQRLRAAGWVTVALTNSAPASVEAQLDRAGLAALFDQIVSVEAVGTYKPAAAPYRHVAELLDADPGELWMVACHDWDLAGARAVGLSTAYVRRTGLSYADSYPPPDLVVADFGELADGLIDRDSS